MVKSASGQLMLRTRARQPRNTFSSHLESEAAGALRLARLRHPPMGAFLQGLRDVLGWPSLCRQTLYDWETGNSLVPAAVLLAAAELSKLDIESLLAAARALHMSESEFAPAAPRARSAEARSSTLPS
jgi:hypothetical protein